MAKIFSSICLALALGSGAAVLIAADNTPATAPATAPATRPRPPAARVNIGTNMNAMERALTSLQDALKDPVKPDVALTALSELERNAVIAKSGAPGGRNLTADQRAKTAAAYHTMMTKLIRQMLDIEDNVNAGKYKEANDGVTTLIEIEKDGHKQFTPPNSPAPK